MGYIANSAFLGFGVLAFFFYQRQRQRITAARSHGCEPAIQYHSKEPFFGFDFQMKMYMNIPFLYQQHQRLGTTYQSRSWATTPTVCTIAPENIRAINMSRDFGVAPMRLPGMEYFCGKGFITTDGDIWSHSRRLLKPSFESSNVRDLAILRAEVDSFLEQLPKDGSAVDLQPLLYVMFLNSALNFVLGVLPWKQPTEAPLTADEFVNSFHKALVYSMFRVMLGRAWSLVPQGGYVKTCAAAHSFIDFYINQAFAQRNSLKNNSLIRALSAQTNDPDLIRSQVIQAMMAAQDTTSELLTNVLFLLSRYPKYWKQLRAEFVDKNEDDLSSETLLSSKLVENILHESLRLYPIFALIGRVALRDTKLPVGGGSNNNSPMFIPKDTTVVMGYYALHRNPNVFGDDVETFRPERWESIEPTQWEFLGFGGGNRACLGKHKAMLEASYVLARMSQSIEKLESRDDREWKGELKMTCKSAYGCKVAVH